APEGLQAQGVRGQEIFPNTGYGGPAQPGDQFFACLLGRTAAELPHSRQSAGSYKAVYTQALLDGLRGYNPEHLEDSGAPAAPAQYVRPVPLGNYLRREVPAQIRRLGLHYRYSQQPDALIMAHDGWLSRLTQVPKGPVTRSITHGWGAPAPSQDI